MSNLPETPTYDAGVYQLETTDAVVGGAAGKSNASAINLANRTAYLKARVDALANIQCFSVHRNGVNSGAIADATPTKIQFTTKEIDPLNVFDAVTNYRFTATIAGLYFFTLSAAAAAQVAGMVTIPLIYKNGAEHSRSAGLNQAGSNIPHPQLTRIIELSIGDYIEFYILWSGSTGSPALSGTKTKTFACAYYLGT